jgi:signal transduction histidine kinase
MATPREASTVRLLVEFSRLISRAAAPAEVSPVLARAAVEHLGVDAAVVFHIDASGSAKLAASHGLRNDVRFEPGPDLVGEEIGEAFLASTKGAYAFEQSFPLISAGGLFGYLVVLQKRANAKLDEEALAIAEGLVGLAAAGLSCAEQYAELARSYAELRASRELLARGQKLRALGQMSAGVAHDLKNILNPLHLHLQFLERGLPKNADDARASIVEMKGVLKRGLETIDRLRDFSRQTPQNRVEPADLDRIAAEALAIARPRMRARHDVHIQVVERLGAPPQISIVTSEAIAATVNLLVNAVDAMTKGGTIILETGARDGGAWIRVADDGPGMPPEVEQRVFEPFFSTKGDEGTGLGLAMVYAFVQRHGGKVELETAPGKGASFTLWFPSSSSSPR